MNQILSKLKSLWPLAVGAVALLDVVVGFRSGKAINNVTMIPSLLAAAGCFGWTGLQWLNSRVVSARVINQPLPMDLQEQMLDLLKVAADPDVSEEMAAYLGQMAAAKIVNHKRRTAPASLLTGKPANVQIIEPAQKVSER